MKYWDLKKAVEELKRRQENKNLVNKVNQFLGDNCPVDQGLNGFLARHIASARLEDIQFEERCQKVGLQSKVLEFSSDLFVSNNSSKMRLIHLYICDGYGMKGGVRVQRIDLLEYRKNGVNINGVPLCQIKTKWGEFLGNFHHRSRQLVSLKGEFINISPWLKSFGSAKDYYKPFLTVYLTRGILFENFESAGFPTLDVFTKEVVLPTWRWVKSNFGYYPLIVRHPNANDSVEEEKILNWYPREILEAIPPEFR